MNMPPLLRHLALACACAFAAASHAGDAPLSTRPLPADWYPESIAVGPDGSFYVGSWRQGAVARIRPGADQPDVLVTPGANGLSNGQGVLVDARRGLLWICSGTFGFTTVPTQPSALKSYDLATGAPRASYALPDKGYCNDLAQDEQGNLYVTDSFQPRVFRWRDGDAALEIWKQDPAFAAGPEGFKLNGIAIDGKHVYVSTVTAASYLLRIDMKSDGSAGDVARIDMPRTLKNADAIRSAGPDRLVIFESNAFGHNGPYGGEISLATLAGHRATSLVTLVAGLNDPSSGVIANGRVYYIESKYSLLFAHKGDDAGIPRHVPFDVQSVPLPP
ncbi:SMP-30/gluconolactonase/LRE family protein [Dyella japonica]|uniref:SMP-30/Gluconolactonase/LRE-like region domain-containing protein n=1 Tax=Dyella japonica A8 TaxID=1217721 RepID=A0A075K4Z4_9GAMM|nr:hypothetical protein [Dyella japonica]AIF49291.1 hypothetical protein HY57_19565 [Dyella japonica A8]